MDEMVIEKLFGGVYKDTRVLITGHTGFKGSWLAFWLNKMGAKVCGYALDPNTDPAHINLLNLTIRSEQGDIRDSRKLNEVFKDFNPEIVFHLAAQPLVRLSYNEPVATYETNVMGTMHVLEACRNTSSVKSVIVVTTDKCYENKEWEWGYRENDPMGGYDPYSSSKGCAEILCASYRNSYFNIKDFGIKHNVLLATARAGNVIGGGDWAEDRLIPDVFRAAENNQPVQIRNPHSTRPWQHVLEPLSGYLLLGQKLFEGRVDLANAWNFGPEQTGIRNVGDIMSALKKEWNKLAFTIDKGDHPHEAGLLKLDCSKANQLLNWRETLNIEQTLNYTVSWYRSFYESGSVDTEQQLYKYIELATSKVAEWIK